MENLGFLKREWKKFKKVLNLPSCIGVWRSPVAYTSGGRVVAGSNPVTPT